MTRSTRKKQNNKKTLLISFIIVIILFLLLLKSCGRHDAVNFITSVIKSRAPETTAPVSTEPEPEPEPEPKPIPEPEPEPVKKPAPKPEKPVITETRPVVEEPVETPPVPEEIPEEQPMQEVRVEERPVVRDIPPPEPNPSEEEKKLWRKTRNANTEEAYRNYLSRFPDGRHHKQAEEILRSGMYPAGRNSQGYEEFRHNKTGTMFVLIPAGEFLMGSPDGEGEPDEHPRHKVYLDAFYLGKYEVTIGQYEKFCNEAEHSMPEKPWLEEDKDHPIIYPTWEDAKAYCDWAGLRLPTEAEWEKAARGNTETTYYWGDKPARDMANFIGTGGHDVYETTSPVGSFPPNGYGVCDMAGNIWEWCSDWYDNDYYEKQIGKNPRGPRRGKHRVIRGGSWNYEEENMRPAFRTKLEPKHWYDYNGFRAALDYMPE